MAKSVPHGQPGVAFGPGLSRRTVRVHWMAGQLRPLGQLWPLGQLRPLYA